MCRLPSCIQYPGYYIIYLYIYSRITIKVLIRGPNYKKVLEAERLKTALSTVKGMKEPPVGGRGGRAQGVG
jgi:hypothetical protein